MHLFFNKKGKVFIQYIEILEKIRKIMKSTFNRELIIKKHLKAEKKKHKRSLQCLYAPVILVDSIYRKDEDNYSKMFSEKYYFNEDMGICCSNSDEEYYDEERINFLLKILKK